MRERFAARGPASATAIGLCAVLLAVWSPAQEGRAQEGRTQGGRERSGRGAGAITVLRVGTVHPVSGPAIQDGVVVVRGRRIAAVGKAGEVEIPDGATEIAHPDGHAYPGLVDALSTAFCDAAVRDDGGVDAGLRVDTALDPYDPRSRELIRWGITTAYVSNRSGSAWRGVGAIVRPNAEGFGRLGQGEDDGDGAGAALQLRMTAGPGPGHALVRQKQLRTVGDAFDGLDQYEKSFAEFDKKKKEYDEAFEKYLEYWRKKKPANADGKGEPKPEEKGGAPADGEPARGAGGGTRSAPPEGGGPPDGGQGGRRGTRGGGARRPREGATPAEGGSEASAPAAAPAPTGGGNEDKPPERPKFPKEPRRDPAKDTLLDVKNGKLPLRVEAHRLDEIDAALALATGQAVQKLVLEHGTGAVPLAARLAERGTPVILTDVAVPHDSPYVAEADRGERLAARLSAAGVPIAIASGDVGRARFLPLLAAAARGQGMDEDAAVRAITLTAAEILGVAGQVGSLEPQKLADIVVTSGPLLSSSSKILRVLSAGRTAWEAR
jgi:hypothetical protein